MDRKTRRKIWYRRSQRSKTLNLANTASPACEVEASSQASLVGLPSPANTPLVSPLSTPVSIHTMGPALQLTSLQDSIDTLHYQVESRASTPEAVHSSAPVSEMRGLMQETLNLVRHWVAQKQLQQNNNNNNNSNNNNNNNIRSINVRSSSSDDECSSNVLARRVRCSSSDDECMHKGYT